MKTLASKNLLSYNKQSTKEEDGINHFYMHDVVASALSSTLVFDCCPNGCLVFLGEHCGDHFSCQLCMSPRYGACFRSGCFAGPNQECRHDYRLYRTPGKEIHYRSISSVLQRLLGYPTFRSLVQYVNISPKKQGDIMYSPMAQRHLFQLQKQWNQSKLMNECKVVKDKFIHRNGTRVYEIIPIFLLFGLNYDGTQPFSHKAVKFKPLLFSILNLPPYLRYSMGNGMFTLSIFTSDPKAKADSTLSEQFILNTCFINELLMLNDGLLIDDPMDSNVKYCVLARLILYMVDIKELEHLLGIQATNSNAYCIMCGNIKGGLKLQLGKTVMMGHRVFLPITHEIRSFGQGYACCPICFYTDYYSKARPDDMITISKTFKLPKAPYSQPRALNNPADEPLSLLGISASVFQQMTFCSAKTERLKDFLVRKQGIHPWFHQNTCGTDDFKHYLYYHFADLREQVIYERVSTAIYFERAYAAVKEKRKQEDGRAKVREDYAFEGVKQLTLFARLPYFELKMFLYDAFHVLLDVVKAYLNILSGERAINDGIQLYCKTFKFQPFFTGVGRSQSECGINPWILNKNVQDMFDAWVEAILVPKGFKNHFFVKEPFKATGNLIGMGKIQVFTVLIDLLICCIKFHQPSFPTAYLKYFKILADDMRLLLASHLTESQLGNLFYRIVETVSVGEGLMFHSESLYPNHELIDLVAGIKEFGCIKNWWTLGGERGVAKSKRKVEGGGCKFDVTALEREYEEEDYWLGRDYEASLKALSGSQDSQAFPVQSHSRVLTEGSKYLIVRPHKNNNAIESDTWRVSYNDQKVLMGSNLKEITIDEPYEMEVLFEYLDQCATRYVASSAPAILEKSLLKSRLLRFHFYYLNYQYPRSVSNESFYRFLQAMAFNPAWLIENSLKAEIIKQHGIYDCLVEKRKVWLGDCDKDAVTSLLTLKIVWSDELRRGEILFRGRGFDFRESKEDSKITGRPFNTFKNTETGFVPTKPCNILAKNWERKVNRGSWCCYQNDKFVHNTAKKSADLYNYAQINGFGTIVAKDDVFLHNQTFASVTARRIEMHHGLHFVKVADFDSYNPDKRFVDINHLHNTAVLILPFSDTTRLKPYISSGKYRNTISNAYLCLSQKEVSVLCMIPLEQSDIMTLDSDQWLAT